MRGGNVGKCGRGGNVSYVNKRGVVGGGGVRKRRQ